MDHSMDRPARYTITVSGVLTERWRRWFVGMDIEPQDSGGGTPSSRLSGVVPDQAALRGLLVQLWDMGLVILSLKRIEDDADQVYGGQDDDER